MKKFLSLLLAAGMLSSAFAVTSVGATDTEETITYPRAVFEQNFDGMTDGVVPKDSYPEGFSVSANNIAIETGVAGKSNFDKSLSHLDGTYSFLNVALPDSNLSDGEYQHISFEIMYPVFGTRYMKVASTWSDGELTSESEHGSWIASDSNNINRGYFGGHNMHGNQWYKVDMIVSSSGAVEVYGNGTLASTHTLSGAEGYTDFCGITKLIFRDQAGNEYFDNFKSEVVNEKPVFTDATYTFPRMYNYNHVDSVLTGTQQGFLGVGAARAYNNTTYLNSGSYYQSEIVDAYGNKTTGDKCIHLFNAEGTATENNVAVHYISPNISNITSGDKLQLSFDFYVDPDSNPNASKRVTYRVVKSGETGAKDGITLFREWRGNALAGNSATIGKLDYGKWYSITVDIEVRDSSVVADYYINGMKCAEDAVIDGTQSITKIERINVTYDNPSGLANGMAVDNMMFRYYGANGVSAPYAIDETLISDDVLSDTLSHKVVTLSETMTAEELLNSVSTAGNSIISVVDAEGNTVEANAVAAGNKVKVVKEYDLPAYYDISVNNTPYADLDFEDTSAKFNLENTTYIYSALRSVQMYGFSDTEKFTVSKAQGVGSKADTDTAYLMQGTAVPNSDETHLRVSPHLGRKIVAEGEFYIDNLTLNMQLFRDDNAGRNVLVSASARDHVFNVNGRTVKSFKDGEWYKIAIELDAAANSANIYIDGELVAENETVFTDVESFTELSQIRYSIDNLKGSEAAPADYTLGVDNIKIYQGEYNAEADDATISIAQNGFILAESDEGVAMSDIKAALPADATVSVYYDGELQENPEIVYDGDVIVVVSPSGTSTKEYTVADTSADTFVDAEIIKDETGSRVTAAAQMVYDKACVLYIAKYSGGKLISVKSVGTNAEGYAKLYDAKADGMTYKAMLWEDGIMKPVCEAK